ncbi:TetR/AcrR family transcriptional regulator C-terminal domain-containing protein [Novosphingobium sp. BL-52-GroH]|uniref:TetR/AcrR family transcriptional regulator C-terminal domain-containing protein n=1 Tax=Novosphingobium sp. BL-52-GroH TaxID=3349877 RepID=UPI00384B6DDB
MAACDILLHWLLEPDALALYRMIIADAARHPGLAQTVDGPFQQASEAVAAILAVNDDRTAETIRLGADMFVRLVAGEALDRAAQGIEPAGITNHTRERSHAAVEFFVAGWSKWRTLADDLTPAKRV